MACIVRMPKFFRQESFLGIVLPNFFDTIRLMIELQTTKDVIIELGGTAGIADLTAANAKAISVWRAKGRFPWKTYPIITAALRERGKSAPDVLFGMDHTPKKNKKRRAA
jgi:hypothetical protein